MTFEYRDPDYDLLRVEPAPHHSDGPRIILHAEFTHDLGTDMAEVAVPLDRVEEVIAGIRDAARTASGQQPEPTMAYGDGKGRVYCQRCAPTVEAASVPLTVNHVDHWELCPSCGRHVVDVAREAPAVGQPAEAQAADEARPSQSRWRVEGYDADQWNPLGSAEDDRETAVAKRAAWIRRLPDMPTRLVRETTTWTVEDDSTWVPQYGSPLSPDEQATETRAASDETVEDER